jgi:hypothetical protein
MHFMRHCDERLGCSAARYFAASPEPGSRLSLWKAMREQDAVLIERTAPAQPMHAVVVLLCCGEPPGYSRSHEGMTFNDLARRIAALKGCVFAGEYDPSASYPGAVYWVPSRTIIGAAAANALGIFSDADLFGGVVPYAFMATKAIVHPLVDPAAGAPCGWSHEFAERVRELVPFGFTVFSPEDARCAGARLLERGPTRLKPVRQRGARAQVVVADRTALEGALRGMDPAEIHEHGLVLEENFEHVTTYSIGQVSVAELVAAYYGTQRLTTDNAGDLVYGGSDLVVRRGDFEALLRCDLPPEARRAATHAQAFDGAANELFPSFYSSRRNYDVLCGDDSSGRRRCALLEQSWQIGGASSAELAALEVFRADAAIAAVRASTIEVFGESAMPPPQASVHFRGADEHLGFLTKYTMVEPYGVPR